MIARTPRRVVRRRNRRSGAPRLRVPSLERGAVRPALAALAVVLIGTGLRAVAVADADAVHAPAPEPGAVPAAPASRTAAVEPGASVAAASTSLEAAPPIAATPASDTGTPIVTMPVPAPADAAVAIAAASPAIEVDAHASSSAASLFGARTSTVAVPGDDRPDDAVPPLATGGGAAADEERAPASSSFTRRPYVAIGGGVSRLEPESPSDALTIAEDTSAAGEIGIGYDVTRWLSGEFHAADLGAAGVDFLGTDVGDVDYRVYGLSAVFYLFNPRDGFVPFASGREGAHRREGLSLFGRFGIGGLSNDSDRVDYRQDYTSHAVFGAGLEYGFRNGFALRAELQAFDTDARYAGVSVLKRFGRVRAAAPLAAAVPAVLPPAAALPPPVERPAPAPVPDLPIVHFDFDRSELRPESLARLDGFVEAVEDDERPIAIDGHTDWIGPERYNEGLSDRRAEAVRDYLVSRGIAAARITTRGFGETRPVTLNTTDEGRALNRRAELRLE